MHHHSMVGDIRFGRCCIHSFLQIDSFGLAVEDFDFSCPAFAPPIHSDADAEKASEFGLCLLRSFALLRCAASITSVCCLTSATTRLQSQKHPNQCLALEQKGKLPAKCRNVRHMGSCKVVIQILFKCSYRLAMSISTPALYLFIFERKKK